jgi:predicted ester cyclase
MPTPQIIERLSQNEQTVRGFLSALDRNQAIPTEFIAPDFAFVFNSDKPTDLRGWQELGKAWFTAFPGSKHICEATFAQGDRVFAHLRATGSHKGPLFGIPPSGKPIDIVGNACFTFANGKISRAEPVWDMLTLMQQVGAVPKPGQ